VIIQSLRFRAPLYLAVTLFLAGFALTAKATTPVLESQMKAFVYWTLAVVLFAVLGSAAAFISYLDARRERAFDIAIGRLEAGVERAFAAIAAHDNNSLAHTAASEHNHSPMNEKLDRLDQRQQEIYHVVLGLKAEHDLIRSEEDELCSILRARRAAEIKRRSADPPEFDARPLRETK
jgi:hypothetical protein